MLLNDLVGYSDICVSECAAMNLLKDLDNRICRNCQEFWFIRRHYACLSRRYHWRIRCNTPSNCDWENAGITLSKRRNRLQKDELLFREVITAEAEEKEMDEECTADREAEELSWEELLIDDENIAESDTEVA